MDAPGLLFVVFLVVFLVVALVRHLFSREQRIKRALRNQDSTPIRGLERDAIQKISGTVRRLDRELEAPLTGRSCVFYRVLVEEYRSSGKSGHYKTLINEYDATDFLVEDPSGVARVDVNGADPVLVLDAHFTSGTFNSATPRLDAYLARFGEQSTGLLGYNKRMRYREGVLEPGETVAVLGKVTMELDPAPREPSRSYRSRPERAVLTLPREGLLLLSDDPSVIDLENRSFTGAARAAGGATSHLACPHCGARTGFRSSPDKHFCLSCNRSFTG